MNSFSPFWSQILLIGAHQCSWAHQGHTLNQTFGLYLNEGRHTCTWVKRGRKGDTKGRQAPNSDFQSECETCSIWSGWQKSLTGAIETDCSIVSAGAQCQVLLPLPGPKRSPLDTTDSPQATANGSQRHQSYGGAGKGLAPKANCSHWLP